MIERRCYCDRCKKEIKRHFNVFIQRMLMYDGIDWDSKTEEYELCKDCLIDLKKWVKGETE